MFKIGDYVVYGRSGICEVTDITTMDMSGVSRDKLFYILRPYKDKTGKIFTPVDNEKIVIRAIITKEEARELLARISEIQELAIQNERMRETIYKETMRTCECIDWIRLIKTIYVRKQERSLIGKKITATDDRYMKMAEVSLYSELSLVLELPEEELEKYVLDYIDRKNVSS